THSFLSDCSLPHRAVHSFPTRRSSDLVQEPLRKMVRFECRNLLSAAYPSGFDLVMCRNVLIYFDRVTQQEVIGRLARSTRPSGRSEEHTSELQSRENLVCRLLLEKKKP